MKHCRTCNSQRPGDTCWKCGTETHEPHPDWEYPELPPVFAIRNWAAQVGYAIGEHGSKERDLDLIAAPWAENAVSADELIEFLCEKLNAVVSGTVEDKPLGRKAVILQMRGWYRPLDLSICPKA